MAPNFSGWSSVPCNWAVVPVWAVPQHGGNFQVVGGLLCFGGIEQYPNHPPADDPLSPKQCFVTNANTTPPTTVEATPMVISMAMLSSEPPSSPAGEKTAGRNHFNNNVVEEGIDDERT